MLKVFKVNEDVKAWLDFLLVLIVRGGAMALGGWAVSKLLEESWSSSPVAVSLVYGFLLILGLGRLHMIVEKWP